MATMEKRGVGRPPTVEKEMLDQVKSGKVGEWILVGEFEPQTAKVRAERLRSLQGNIEVNVPKVPVYARRVRGRASRPTAAK